MIILNYYAPAYQTDSNICKFINKKWMNPHVTDIHIQQKKSPHQHSETWTPKSTYTSCYYRYMSVYTCISITDKFHTIIKKKKISVWPQPLLLALSGQLLTEHS